MDSEEHDEPLRVQQQRPLPSCPDGEMMAIPPRCEEGEEEGLQEGEEEEEERGWVRPHRTTMERMDSEEPLRPWCRPAIAVRRDEQIKCYGCC